jgi:small subunit ribosomal protein S16
MGSRGKPFYRVVVANSSSPRDGRIIESLGYYDPRTEPPTIKIDADKAKSWVAKGAQPSDTARALIQKQEKLATEQPAK